MKLKVQNYNCMKKIHKKIIGILLLLPLFFAITFCCCLDETAMADETHSQAKTEHHSSHQADKADHSEHQHSDGDHECSCPKHLSFLSQAADIVLKAPFNQILAKDFVLNLGINTFALLPLMSNQTHGPPDLDHLDRISLPIYLKNSNLRL